MFKLSNKFKISLSKVMLNIYTLYLLSNFGKYVGHNNRLEVAKYPPYLDTASLFSVKGFKWSKYYRSQ